MLRNTRCLPLVVLMTTFCNAHQDAVLSISPNGVISGLPSKFGNAAMQVKFASPVNKSRPVESFSLTVGKNRIEFPPGLVGLLRTQSMAGIRASASWYHQSMLPHYIKIDFTNYENDPNSETSPHISILLNLSTIKIMRITAMLPNGSGEGLQGFPIDLKALCLADLYPRIADTKTKLAPYL